MLRYNDRPRIRANGSVDPEVSRILTAAVINKKFRSSLLSSPAAAIKQGYCGEPFHLTLEQKKRISGIRENSLEKFAAQLARI